MFGLVIVFWLRWTLVRFCAVAMLDELVVVFSWAGQSWVDLGTYAGADGKKDFYAFSYKADLKSLVWYSPENFEDAGYEVPQTMEELKALTDQIVADGDTPWCIGLGSGGATGWPATDCPKC